MDRRRFLASAALLGASGLAGCTQSSGRRPGTPTAPPRVADWQFETSNPDDISSVDTDEPPTVECTPGTSSVEIQGVAEAGNQSDWLLPKRMTVEEDTFTFVVGVYQGCDSNCGQTLEITSYESTFEFEERLPSRVVAIERPYPNEDEPNRTVRDC